MKIIVAIGDAHSMTKNEVESFLERKLNLQLVTIDEMGDPNIHPIWCDYDKDKKKLFVMTPKASKKA
jgi:general stress protein 26